MELTSNFSHLAEFGQSASDTMRCVLHKTDQSDRQTMAPQGICYLGRTRNYKFTDKKKSINPNK